MHMIGTYIGNDTRNRDLFQRHENYLYSIQDFFLAFIEDKFVIQTCRRNLGDDRSRKVLIINSRKCLTVIGRKCQLMDGFDWLKISMGRL